MEWNMRRRDWYVRNVKLVYIIDVLVEIKFATYVVMFRKGLIPVIYY
jgi:hypothetical protein